MNISCNLALFCASFRWLGPHRWFHTISLRLLKRFIVFCRLRVWNIRSLTICELIVLKSCHSFCPFAFLDRCVESNWVCIFFVVGWIVHIERVIGDHDIYTLRFFSYLMWLLLDYLWRQVCLTRVIIVVDKVLILDDWCLCFSTNDIFLWHRIWVDYLCQMIATSTCAS